MEELERMKSKMQEYLDAIPEYEYSDNGKIRLSFDCFKLSVYLDIAFDDYQVIFKLLANEKEKYVELNLEYYKAGGVEFLDKEQEDPVLDVIPSSMLSEDEKIQKIKNLYDIKKYEDIAENFNIKVSPITEQAYEQIIDIRNLILQKFINIGFDSFDSIIKVNMLSD